VEIKTEIVRHLFEGKGYPRDDSALFSSNVCYGGKGKPILVVDESSYAQNTDWLIEDCEREGAHDLADEIRKWVQNQAKNEQKRH
jgi:hypothetical protein